MAVTGQEIIDEAAESIGILGVGTVLSGEETDRFLRALNTMIDGWAAERAIVYAMRDEQFTLPAAAATRTIGPAGQFNTARPARIEWAFIRESDADYPLEILSAKAAARIPDKAAAAGWPTALWYKPTVPLGVLQFISPPERDFELHLGTWTPISGFATPGTSVDLPPGYKEALVTNLCVRMAPRYERSIPQEIAALAVNTKRKIISLNHEPLTPVSSEVCHVNSGWHANIITGV